MLPLLHHHFTGYYTCSVLILLDIALAADQFYWILLLQRANFTRCCLHYTTILLDIAVAAVDIY